MGRMQRKIKRNRIRNEVGNKGLREKWHNRKVQNALSSLKNMGANIANKARDNDGQ